MTHLQWVSLSTPVGPVWVGCSERGVARVRFAAPPGTARGGEPGGPARDGEPGGGAFAGAGQTVPGQRAAATLAEQARAQIAQYLTGRRREFDLPLDWDGCSPVQRQVLGTLVDTVGYGQTVSYGELARRSELPADIELPARAVGQVMGANPLPVIVPCHRVLATDGLGGYSGGAGLEVKRWFLILEGALPPTLDWVPARAEA